MCDSAAMVYMYGPTALSVVFFSTDTVTPKSKTSI